MDPNYDQRLEAEISRQLKALPELTAPDSLVGRVMAAIDESSAVPWYRRSWQTWTPALQWGSLSLMLLLFAAGSYAVWDFSRSGLSLLALQKVGEWASAFDVVLNTLSAILNALVLAVQKLGVGFFVACLIMAGLSYTLFVGLGTLYVRLALIKRWNSIL